MGRYQLPAEELVIAAMSRALDRADLASPERRAAAYLAADIPPADMLRFDAEAVKVQGAKRRAFHEIFDGRDAP